MSDAVSTLYIVMAIVFIWLIIVTMWLQHVALQLLREHNRTSKELTEVYERMTEQLKLVDRYNWLNNVDVTESTDGTYTWKRPNKPSMN